MGAITRTLANNITTGGVILPSGINNNSLSSVTALPAGVGGNLTLLSTTNFSGTSSHVEISLDYSDYVDFLFVCNQIQGDNTNAGENLDVHFKRAGQGTFDTGSTDYGFGGFFYDTSASHNINTADAMEVFRGRAPDEFNMFVAQITGAGSTTTKTSLKAAYTQCDVGGGGTSAQTNHGTNFSSERIVAMRFSFTTGSVTTVKGKLYGYGE